WTRSRPRGNSSFRIAPPPPCLGLRASRPRPPYPPPQAGEGRVGEERARRPRSQVGQGQGDGVMGEPRPTGELKHTPLHALHVRLGARMVAFAGYDMPVQYSTGIIKEHLHTRAAAGLCDVSHMGQIALRPRSGRVADAARALETLLPGDLLGLAAGR